MKETINASELALLLSVPKEEASGKIMLCDNVNYDDIKNPVVSVKNFEKRHKINLTPYLEDCWSNYMKRAASRGRIMNFPQEKIWHGEDRPYPKTISLPKALQGLISPEVREEIKQAWEEKYRHRLPDDIRDILKFNT